MDRCVHPDVDNGPLSLALLRNKPARVRDRFRAAQASGHYFAAPPVVLYELWYGVQKSSHVTENTERLGIFLPATWISCLSTTRTLSRPDESAPTWRAPEPRSALRTRSSRARRFSAA
jgi:hypothetical protein